MPVPALVLGLAGAVPFVAAPIAMLVGPDWLKVTAYLRLMEYAALILAFTGAVHWGLAVAASARISVGWGWYAASVAPTLVGLVALVLLQPIAKATLFAIAYAAVFMVDLRAAKAGLAPDWYPKLRKPLTVIAVLGFAGVGVAARLARGAA